MRVMWRRTLISVDAAVAEGQTIRIRMMRIRDDSITRNVARQACLAQPGFARARLCAGHRHEPDRDHHCGAHAAPVCAGACIRGWARPGDNIISHCDPKTLRTLAHEAPRNFRCSLDRRVSDNRTHSHHSSDDSYRKALILKYL
jgi:hypothetical protein